MRRKYRVVIDPEAKQDLKEIFVYVALNDNLDSADNLLNKLEERLYKLERFPERGRIPEELRSTGLKRYLEIHFKPYRIVYEINKGIIYIHAVLDGRRNIQEILSERLLR